MKWDIQSFVNHRKASLQISTLELVHHTLLLCILFCFSALCNLYQSVKFFFGLLSVGEQLKDTILEGIHPVAASLKENFGVDFVDKCLLNLPCDGSDPTSSLLRSNEDDYGGRTMLAEENGCL